MSLQTDTADQRSFTSAAFEHGYSAPGTYQVNVTAFNLHSYFPYGAVGHENNLTQTVHVQRPVVNWAATVASPWIIDDGREYTYKYRGQPSPGSSVGSVRASKN